MSAGVATARISLLLVAGVLLFGIALPVGDASIPRGPFWGLDLHNLHRFHNCELRNEPYADPAGGRVCGDVEGRAMKYPPLLYWSFAWTRLVSFEQTLRIWAVVIVLGCGLSLLLWMPPSERKYLGWTIPLLLLQYPAVFAIERGNNDVLVLALWTCALLAVQRDRFALAGVFGGVAVAAKLYPVFALAVIALSLVGRWRSLTRFVVGAIAAGTLAAVALPRDTRAYLEVLRSFAGERPPPVVFGHGLPTYFPTLVASLLGAGLVGLWVVAGRKAIRAGTPEIAFAGALAISTFFARTSYDYNLITVYPLILILILAARRTRGAMEAGILAILLLIAVAGRRALFLDNPSTRVLLAVFALLLCAAWFVSARTPSCDEARDR